MYDRLKMIFDDNEVISISLRDGLLQIAPRFSSQVLSANDFISSVCNALDIFYPYAYITKQEALYL